jgi:hypothetical protein
MEHPLIGDISKLSIDQLQETIKELSKKLTIAYRSGNSMLAAQVQMALETYQNRYHAVVTEMYKTKEQEFENKIDIS